MATTPVWDRMEAAHMGGLIASGTAVGLPESRKGNSESGHITIGAGQAVLQDEVIINKAIREGRFVQAEAFQQAFEDAASRGGAVHLLGLLSKTSSHGSIDYALELLRHATAIGFESTYLHVITDGRSTRSKRLPNDLEQLAGQMKGLKTQGIVTLVGRGIALDRGGSYETKTRIAYDALVEGTGEQACCDSL
jgi:2,3-bisphosphoglycerate-independent phosphoglycerate mutase